MIVYVKTQGSRIVKEGRHLLVKKGDATYHTLFTYKLDQIVIFGNVEITHKALAQILRFGIDLVFLTLNGRYLGRVVSQEPRNVRLRKRQWLLLDDHAFVLKMAKAFVAGKLTNMATMLMRIKRTKGATLAGRKAQEIKGIIQMIDQASTIESVRGFEGKGSALYFEAFHCGFVEDWGFTRRVRRPPTDPVNSVLSLLYTFLMNRVYSAVRVAGLDPYPGFLHAIDYGRYSLVLDLMEEFRPIIADSLAYSLFNLKILGRDDFIVEKPVSSSEPKSQDMQEIMEEVTKDPIGLISSTECEPSVFDLPEQRIENSSPEGQITGKYPVKLKDEAFHRVIDAFEKKLTTEFYYPPAERRLTYGEVLIYQAGHLRKVIEDEIDTYQPVLLK
ncbi:MAG: CRISPR-associated endonuclease Cas1 [Desulfomonilia bacterium]|jgi:CRISPR-associated protein Cas1